MRGSVLVFTVLVWLCSIASVRAAERIPAEVFGRGSQMKGAAVSPSGRYVAYVSDESGAGQIYLKRFPEGTGKWQVSVDGGNWPFWREDGLSGDAVSQRGPLAEIHDASDPAEGGGAGRNQRVG